MILALIIIAGVIAYFFIGVTTFAIANEIDGKDCRHKKPSSYRECGTSCGHWVNAFMMGIVWPVTVPVVALWVGVGVPITKFASWLSKWIAKMV